MSAPTRKALVLGHDSRAFLAIIRSLGRAGIRVHVGWFRSDSVALRSRYVTARHDLPEFREDSPQWLTALTDLMQRERYDLVIPCNDAHMTAFHQQRAALCAAGRPYLLGEQAFDVLFDKFKTNALARSLGLTLPRERVLTAPADPAALLAEFGSPVVLKPQQSYNAGNPDDKLTVAKGYDRAGVERFLSAMLRVGPVAAQKNFVGIGVGVELLLDRGAPLLTFQHERVHEPLYGGGSSYRRSVPVDPRLLEEALRLLRALDYTGVAMVEFKLDPRSGDYVFIEVNARFWGSLPLALAAGADFPLGLYQLLVEGRSRVAPHGRPGLYCRNWYHDLAWQRVNFRADKRDPTLATRPLGRVLREALLHTLTLRERSDTLVLDDPAPGLAEIGQIVGLLAGKLRDAVRRRWLNTGWARRRLAGQARRVLSDARRVLFVCKGNVCRSPFAEHYYRKLRPGLEICSAGYYPRPDRPSPAHAVTAARQWGLELDPHRSRVLTRDLVERHDAICVFDYENYCNVVAAFPQQSARVVYLGPLAGAQTYIADPWGGDLERFLACYREISAALDRAAR